MTEPTTEPRRATDAEIALASAWVEHHTADWDTDAPDFESAKQGEYEHALEILMHANGGRYTEPRGVAGHTHCRPGRCDTCGWVSACGPPACPCRTQPEGDQP